MRALDRKTLRDLHFVDLSPARMRAHTRFRFAKATRTRTKAKQLIMKHAFFAVQPYPRTRSQSVTSTCEAPQSLAKLRKGLIARLASEWNLRARGSSLTKRAPKLRKEA